MLARATVGNLRKEAQVKLTVTRKNGKISYRLEIGELAITVTFPL